MKGKVLAFITAILFGATMVAAPVVGAAQNKTGATTEMKKPAKKSTKAKATKKKAKKTTKVDKKKPSKKKAKSTTQA